MDCIDEGLLQTYIDDEVSEADKKSIEAHLHDCQKCQQQLVEQQSIKSKIIESINLLAVADERAEVKREPAVRRFQVNRIFYMISAASVLIISIIFFNNYKKPEVQDPLIYYEMDWSVDANKPITDQEFIINMYEVDEGSDEVSIH